MSTEAGAGPFVLVYHADQAEYLCGPDPSPCTVQFWPWDKLLPEGWAVVPVLLEYVPKPAVPLDTGPGQIIDREQLQQERRDYHEPEYESRLAAEAECKDMAFKLLHQLNGMQEHTAVPALRDAIDLAEQLHKALPDGSGE